MTGNSLEQLVDGGEFWKAGLRIDETIQQDRGGRIGEETKKTRASS